MKLDIVYEDEYIIACVKPYGVPSQPDKTYGTDMVTLVKEYLYEKQMKQADQGKQDTEVGEPYVAVINRLDRPVGGIIVFAKDEDTAAKLTDMVQDREISKYYQVVVRGFLDEPEGEMSDWILHDKKTNISKIVPKGTKGAKKAELYYEVLDELDTDEGPVSYLLVELVTGRHHQIRCQMAAHGLPVWGDTKYGSSGSKGKSGKGKNVSGRGNGKKQAGYEIGLYSTRIEFTHPVTGEDIFLHREPEGKAFDIMDQMDW
ncbi:MAG: RluA family pseudouridine synthase [Eubacterium sp.]|nr:RluA family pseudouridine synthase [Eubacterium sp.]